MKAISAGEFAQRCDGKLATSLRVSEISGFALDSRQVSTGDLFIAVRGVQSDGHEFTAEAVERGAVACLVEHAVEEPHILVESVVDALATYAASIRSTFSGPVIGVTGSAGKTTTKEFVAAACSALGPVLKSPGNRNTEYTVPLMWADLAPNHVCVVVEMAMRGFGQIAHLASFCRPNIGVITNLGSAHSELVGSREGVARAKSELLAHLPSDGIAVLPAGGEFKELLARSSAAPIRTFGFETADCQVTHYEQLGFDRCHVAGQLDSERWEATLPVAGKHMALDAAAAMLAAYAAGVSIETAATGLSAAVLPPMRMEVRHSNGVTYLVDTYNASPDSMKAAIEVLAESPCTSRRMAVIGEMRELGAESDQAHRELGNLLLKSGVDEVALMGEMTWLAECEGLRSARVDSIDSVTEFLRKSQKGDVVLIKGSRALGLERALDRLFEVGD